MKEIAKKFYIPSLIFVLLVVPVSALTTTVSIGDVEVMPDSSVTIPIIVNEVTNLGLGRVNVTYNSSVVHVTDVISGTGNALTVIARIINNTAGFVTIIAHDPATPHNGSVIFANVTYKAVGDERSSTALNITARLRNWYYPYSDIPHNVTNGTFTIKPSAEQPAPTPTPSPSTGAGGGGGGPGGGGGYVPTTPTPTKKQTAVEGVAVTPAPATPAPTITPPSTAPTPAPTPAPVPGLPPLFLILIVTAVIVIAGIIIVVLRRK